MVVQESALSGEDVAAKANWAMAELDPAVYYEQALGIYDNLLKFVTGEKDQFQAYFVNEVEGHAEIEKHLRRLLGIDQELAASEEPVCVFRAGDVALFRWSNVIDEKPFDTFYEACRAEGSLLWYSPVTAETSPAPVAD